MPHIITNQDDLTRIKKSKKITDMPQAVLSIPSEVEINDTATVKMPALTVPPTSEKTFSVGAVISPANALKDNDVKLSKYKQLRLKHQGIVELPQTWKTEDTYGVVVDGSSSAYESIPPDPRPLIPVGKNEDGLVITANGTFTETVVNIGTAVYLNPYSNSSSAEATEPHDTIKYNDDASSSSSAGTGLVTPLSLAAAADQAQFADKILDMPGKTGGEAMDEENYLTLPGKKVVTSETYLG